MTFDVAIVGGGPAGTSTALFLVKQCGVAPERIVVLEKARHPREKPCGGAVSAWGLTALARAGFTVGPELGATPMRGLRILDDGGARAGVHETTSGEPERELGAVVRRDVFDAALWRRVAELGVDARDGEAVRGLTRVNGGWEIATGSSGSSRVRAKLLVAADGAGSTVRKLLGVAEPTRKGHLYVLETPLRDGATPADSDAGARAGLCDFDLSPADTVEGYYWDFPCLIDGAPHVSRGIFHANLHAYRDLKTVLARELGRRGIDVASCTLKPFSTRPFVRGTTLVAAGDVLLVGEAAGIDATTGEGIAQAILFGEMAARHLARALADGPRALAGYEREVRASQMGKHLLQSAWLARHVYGRRGAPFRRLLVASPEARAAGARWYVGESLGLGTWLVLGAQLARQALAPSSAPSRAQ